MTDATIDPVQEFREDRARRVHGMRADAAFRAQSLDWMKTAFDAQYMYNFEWLGRPIIQMPADMVAVQEVIWRVRPDVVIETGVAHGGSLILSASLLALLDLFDAAAAGEMLDPRRPKRRVLGVDIDIRAHNRREIEAHPLAARIDLAQGSSTAPEVVAQAQAAAAGKRTLVFLDSMHSHAHVLEELAAYAPLVSPGSYCVVFDTIIEDLPAGYFANRPWNVGDSPKSAIAAFLERLAHAPLTAADGGKLAFEVDAEYDAKLLATASPGGFLKRV